MLASTNLLILAYLFFFSAIPFVAETRPAACPHAGLFLGSQDVTACREDLRHLKGHSGCHGPAAISCCITVDQLLKRQCHCWSEISNSQRKLLLSLALQCERAEIDQEQAESAAPRIKLFVGVLTTGKNKQARQAIRDTWGADPRLHRVLFFSAKPSDEQTFDDLRNEAAAKRDVVVLPTIWEGYFNITHQTLEVMRMSAFDLEATHTLKADDDSYVRVEEVLERVKNAPTRTMFMGFIENPGGGPHRNPASQWHVTEEEWASDKYPPWAHGAGYVLTQDLVLEIAAGAALMTQNHQIFKLEDVAVGSWIEFVGKDRKWEINYVADQGFNYNGCHVQDAVSHYIKPKAMRCMFRHKGACCTSSSLAKPHLKGTAL